MEIISSFIILFAIFICLVSVILGFGYFAVGALRTFEIIIWTCNAVKTCVSLKIIAHLRTFQSVLSLY